MSPQTSHSRPHRRNYIYTRYSTEMQHTRSCEDQARVVRKGLADRGIDPDTFEVVPDEAMVGSREDRPGYQRLQQQIDAGEVGLLAVDQLSRLTRGSNAVALIENLRFHGGRFIAIADNIDTDTDGWHLNAGMLQVINHHAKNDRAHAVRRGQQGRVLDGLGSAGDVPFGYDTVYRDANWAEQYRNNRKPPKDVVIHEEHAAWVRRIFERFIAGESKAAIARWLTQRGAPKPRKSRDTAWHAHGVGRILKNEKYIGRWVWGKTRTVHGSQGRKRAEKLPEDQWTIVERPELRIVDDATWHAARRRQAELDKTYAKKPGQGIRGPKVHPSKAYPTSMLQGLLICDVCGRTLTLQGGAGYLRYGCANAAIERCSNNVGVNRNKAEAALLGLLLQRCEADAGWLDAVHAACVESIESARRGEHHQLDADRRRLDQLQPEIDRLIDTLAQGADFDSIRQRLESSENEKRQLLDRIQRAERALRQNADLPDTQWIRRQLAEHLDGIGDRPTQAAMVMRDLLGQVRVEPIRPPGKKRGWPRLIIALRGDRLLAWAARQLDQGGDHPIHLVELDDEDHVERIEIELGRPSRTDHLAPEIDRLRREGVKWKEICERFDMPQSTASGILARYRRRLAEETATSSTPDPITPSPEEPDGRDHPTNRPTAGPGPRPPLAGDDPPAAGSSQPPGPTRKPDTATDKAALARIDLDHHAQAPGRPGRRAG